MTIIQLLAAAVAVPAMVAVTDIADTPGESPKTDSATLTDEQKEEKARIFIHEHITEPFEAMEEVGDFSIKYISRCPSGYAAYAEEGNDYLEEDIYGVVVYQDGCSREQVCMFHANPYTEVAEVKMKRARAYTAVAEWLDQHSDELAHNS